MTPEALEKGIDITKRLEILRRKEINVKKLLTSITSKRAIYIATEGLSNRELLFGSERDQALFDIIGKMYLCANEGERITLEKEMEAL